MKALSRFGGRGGAHGEPVGGEGLLLRGPAVRKNLTKK
jgi:hypothetical protein